MLFELAVEQVESRVQSAAATAAATESSLHLSQPYLRSREPIAHREQLPMDVCRAHVPATAATTATTTIASEKELERQPKLI